ncbi:MAG: Ig-like domain-containing protein, partial [Bifidobacteriaceae bacterium]|nr:Ig-like domain-containing protein [Bifidobacteriaceae bacterium]
VKVSQKSVRLVAGKSFTLVAKGFTTTGQSAKATFKSNKTSVASVSASGKIKAKKTGKATITIKAAGKSTKVTGNVVGKASTAKVTKVTAKAPKTLAVGARGVVTGTYAPARATGVKVTYATTAASILTVDKAGVITAKAPGTATITVKAGKKTAKVKVTVTAS